MKTLMLITISILLIIATIAYICRLNKSQFTLIEGYFIKDNELYCQGNCSPERYWQIYHELVDKGKLKCDYCIKEAELKLLIKKGE